MEMAQWRIWSTKATLLIWNTLLEVCPPEPPLSCCHGGCGGNCLIWAHKMQWFQGGMRNRFFFHQKRPGPFPVPVPASKTALECLCVLCRANGCAVSAASINHTLLMCQWALYRGINHKGMTGPGTGAALLPISTMGKAGHFTFLRACSYKDLITAFSTIN